MAELKFRASVRGGGNSSWICWPSPHRRHLFTLHLEGFIESAFFFPVSALPRIYLYTHITGFGNNFSP
jgi:hypothetical protein